ncbi:MAG: CHAT domain-containing protein [Kofleriaceae bacterium]
MNKHTILFLAANPIGTDPLALDREARAIQIELERSGHRDRFELVTRWAVEPLDLLRELRKLKPTVVHFSGHGGRSGPGGHRAGATPQRDTVGDDGDDGNEGNEGNESQHSLYFQSRDGQPQRVSARALRETFGAAGSSVQVVVLSACYSHDQAEALRTHVDCVVGMHGAIRDDSARNFAIGFYGGLGEHESVAAAYRQGCAAIGLEGLPDADLPQLAVRDGVDAERVLLAADRRVQATQ